MAALEVLALNTTVPRIQAPQSGDTYTFPRAVAMPLLTANSVLFLNGSNQVSANNTLKFNGTNLGVGATLSSWGANYKALQVGSTAGFVGLSSGNYTYVGSNWYNDNTNNRYISNAGAVLYSQDADSSIHRWYTASSGTAGGTINFGDPKMLLDASGNLGIGTSSPDTKLTVTVADSVVSARLKAATGTLRIRPYVDATSGTIIDATNTTESSYGPMTLSAATLRLFGNSGTGAIIDSSGNLGLAVTPSSWAPTASTKGLDLYVQFGLFNSTSANSGNGTMGLLFNGYYDGAYKARVASAYSGSYEYSAGTGQHTWKVAGIGGAVGSTISLTSAMTLSSDSRLLIGATTNRTQEFLRINGSTQASLMLDNSSDTNGAFVGVFNDAAILGVTRNPSTGVYYDTAKYSAEMVCVGSSSTSYITFGTTTAVNTVPTERMRITSAGTRLLGTSTASASGNVREVVAYDTAAYTQWTRSTGTIGGCAIGTEGQDVRIFTHTGGVGAETFTERARITSTGEMYIAGTTDQGAYNLQVNGTGVWGAGAYVNGSDERLKENIQTLDAGLSIVNQLRPITFQYKADYSRDTNVQPGFVAQELQAALIETDYVDGVVQEGPEYLNVAYQSLIPILTKAIQEQQAIIDALTARVAALE